jgi:hypothetical protein
MCAGRVPERSDVPVEFAAGIPIIRLALAFPTRSGGRNPPVEHTPHTSSKRRNSSHCTCRCGSENHGGLTPAALDGVRLPLKLALPSASRPADHGGLTPAALANVHLFIATIVILPADARGISIRSGGRKPPVEKHLFRRPESHICNSVRIRNQKLGSKSPVECIPYRSSKRGNSSHCTCRPGPESHGGLTIAALENVRCASRKSSFFRRMLVVSATRAGDVRPRGERIESADKYACVLGAFPDAAMFRSNFQLQYA